MRGAAIGGYEKLVEFFEVRIIGQSKAPTLHPSDV